MIPYRLWVMLAFSRIPGNAFSFWIRKTLRWSRGMPVLPRESMDGLFDYLEGPARAAGEAREAELRARYSLEPLRDASTQAIYRKNLYLIDLLDRGADGIDLGPGPLRAVDVGSQDFHYAFGLERWLRYAGTPAGRLATLTGIEIDGYGIYPDFRSRKDYAEAYALQTGNSDVTYRVGDFLDESEGGLDIVTIFYPFVTRHHLLLWGLPLRFFRPAQLVAKAASLTKPGGRLVVFTHTQKEHELFLELGRRSGSFVLRKEGPAVSNLVDFHEDVADRHFSWWERSASK